MCMSSPALIVLIGPTGVGKTALSLRLAQYYQTPILSADSRQLYRDLPIGTAAPTPQQLAQAQHYFVGTLGLQDYYSAAQYEEDALKLIAELHQKYPTLLLTGGSMMYVDALCKGIDSLPTISNKVRTEVMERYQQVGLEALCEELKQLDPIYYKQVDLKNHKRVIHAIEICQMTGKPYSQLRTNTTKKRPFKIVKVGLNRERPELFDRINLRVEQMIAEGLVEEVKSVYAYKNENSLNTVGYKEIVNYLDGTCSLDFAIEKIQRNSRVYAKKQLTWFKKDPTITWFHPDNDQEIIAHIDCQLKQ